MILRAENISISYGPKTVLSDFNLEVGRDEVVGLMGPSGCGKSSFIYALVGALSKIGGRVTGQIIFQSLDLLTIGDERLRPGWDKMALVPQAAMNSFNPVQKLKTTFEEVYRFNPSSPLVNEKERLAELLELVQLPSRVLNQYPHELSGGMKQRLALALAFLLNPDLIILDEATTGLDVLVEADILLTIGQMRNKSQAGILMVSHDRRIIEAFCHRVVSLS